MRETLGSIAQMTLLNPDLKDLPNQGTEMRRNRDPPRNLNPEEEEKQDLAKNPKNLTPNQSKFEL
jgi:hypothetical protein